MGPTKKRFLVGFFVFYKRQDFASVGIAIFGTPLISFAPAPPKQAWAPPPAPVWGGDRPSGWLCQHHLPRRTFYCDQFSDVMCARYQAELDLYLDV